MGKILNFIIIDEFKTKRQGSIYFLTHWHSDHYEGIATKWHYGPIYCSSITRRLLLSKFPKLKEQVNQLKYGQQNIVKGQFTNGFGRKDHVQLKIRIYDSNHMAGSIMILIEYQNKFYLHTGDMRFNQKVAQSLTDLFIKKNAILIDNQQNQQQITTTNIETQQYECKYQIQRLYLDNTFCDPIFMFPPRSFALKLVIKIIDEYCPKKVFLCTDSVGKQQAFIYLSRKYNCKVKISRDRLKYIKCMGIDYKKYFTLKDDPQVWIQVIRKVDKQDRVSQQKNSIAITLTGWANLNDYHPLGYNSFVVPYSLHSNYKQIQMFVKWVRPKKIIPIVYHDEERQGDKFRQKIGSYGGYMFSLCYVKQRGLQYLKSQYENRDKNDRRSSINEFQQQNSYKQNYQKQNQQQNYQKRNSTQKQQNKEQQNKQQQIQI